jgi:hypothetical protein
MKAWKIALAAILGVAIILIAAGAFVLNSLVTGGGTDRLVRAASDALGTKVGLSGYEIEYGSLLRLQPALSLRGLTVANPAGFPARNLLEADRVEALIDVRDAMNKKVHVTSLRILSPKVVIELPAQRSSNLEALLKKEPASTPAPAAPNDSAEPVSVTVDQIEIVGATVSLAGPKDPSPVPALTNLGLSLSDVATGKPAKLDLTTNFFGGANSTLKASGLVGPLSDASLPVDAKAEVRLAPGELPADVRQRLLGELSSAPGADARVALDLSISGKLNETSTAQGKIEFAKFFIGGQGQQNRLALSGQTPIEIIAKNLLSGDSLDIRANKATLKLGAGEWSGNAQVIRQGEKAQGAINGAIRNVDVNAMLTSFASTPNQVFGTLTMPRFALNFEGQDAAAIKRSLNGNGQLTIANGRFKGLSVLSSIERALGGAASKTEGEFAQFNTGFAIRNQVIQLDAITVQGPGIDISGAGSVTFAEAINFRLNAKLTGSAGSLLNTSTRGIIGTNAVIPVTITGTVANPQVSPQIGSLAKGAATNAIQNVLGNFLGRKKK